MDITVAYCRKRKECATFFGLFNIVCEDVWPIYFVTGSRGGAPTGRCISPYDDRVSNLIGPSIGSYQGTW